MNIQYPANWTKEQLAKTCSTEENNTLSEVTKFMTTGLPWNIATYTQSTSLELLKSLVIVNKGTKPGAAARYLFSAKIYVINSPTDVDVYRWI